ncbi:MAG: hypothetical protein A2X40_01930 [Elusimicrobia bacterium GWC2_65_9]|nr:MAG: hypothetical protein A2X40_01930 [Elusimicrobia bacterium GWC2_65_9]
MSQNNSGESILAFLLGGVVGAAIGVLLAPKRGKETREQILDWFEKGREKARHLVDEEREVLHTKKAQVQAAWSAGKKAYQETVAEPNS